MLILSVLFAALAFAQPLGRLPDPGAYVNADGGPLIPLLKSARDKIDIEIYTMNSPTVRSLLKSALKRGVKVRVLKEPRPVGSSCDLFASSPALEGGSQPDSSGCEEEKKFVKELKAAGGVFVPFNKAALCPNGGEQSAGGCYEHGKLALVDGRALISTGNFDETNLCLEKENPRVCNRDYTLVVNERAVVDTLEKIFEADLAAKPYDMPDLIPPSLASRLTVSPFSLKPLVDLIDGARASIDLEAQYLKDPSLNAALTRAAKRGVRVKLTIASACAFGRPSKSEAAAVTATYGAFDKLGVSTRMFTAKNLVNGKQGYMHAKVIVIDGAKAWVGSVNGSTASLTQNREYGLVLDRAEDVALVLDTANADHSSPDTESWQESLNCLKDPSGNGPQG